METKNKINNCSQKEIETILHRILLKEMDVPEMKFRKPNKTIWEDLGVDQI